MSRLALAALVIAALGAAAIVSRLRRELRRQAGEIYALRSAEFVRSSGEPEERDEIGRLRRLRDKLLSSQAEAIVDRGESFSLEQLNQRLGALGVV